MFSGRCTPTASRLDVLNKKCMDERINELEKDHLGKDAHLRSQGSDYTEGLSSVPSNYSSKSHHIIREEITREIQQIIKTQIDNLPDLRGLPGPSGPTGPRGQKGEPGIAVSAASISIPPRSVTVNKSDIVSFYCAAKGYPAPKVIWQKGNSSLPAEGRYECVENGGLLIRNITKSDEGIRHVLNEPGSGFELRPQSIYGLFGGTARVQTIWLTV